MEGNLSTRDTMPGASYGVLGLQRSMHDINHQQQHPHASLHHYPPQAQEKQQARQLSHHHRGSMVCQPMHDAFPLQAHHMHEADQQQTPPTVDYNRGERAKSSPSDKDEPSFNTEEGADGHHHEMGRGKKASPWQRMKWTDSMVKLLITVVSYMGEDAPASDCSGGEKRKFAMLQKKGKWKSVSKVMVERGYHVSPQQCEDKFNDLNKRYKRLTDVLGRGTSCKVVENPALLDLMDHLSEKAKEDVRKILSSKHLFYEEMCSYHNGNRLHLPADPALQRSLQLALMSSDDHDTRRTSQDDVDEDDHGAETDDGDDGTEEHEVSHGYMAGPCFPKRMKQQMDGEGTGFGNPSAASHNCNRRSDPRSFPVDMKLVYPEGPKSDWVEKQLMQSRTLQLEEQRLHIQVQMLELERQRLKWHQFSRKKDRELDKLRMENERMKVENERLALELRRKELNHKCGVSLNLVWFGSSQF